MNGYGALGHQAKYWSDTSLVYELVEKVAVGVLTCWLGIFSTVEMNDYPCLFSRWRA